MSLAPISNISDACYFHRSLVFKKNSALSLLIRRKAEKMYDMRSQAQNRQRDYRKTDTLCQIGIWIEATKDKSNNGNNSSDTIRIADGRNPIKHIFVSIHFSEREKTSEKRTNGMRREKNQHSKCIEMKVIAQTKRRRMKHIVCVSI